MIKGSCDTRPLTFERFQPLWRRLWRRMEEIDMKAKLLGPKDLFATDQITKVLSSLVEPTDASISIEIERLLGELGFSSERPSTMIKFKVLLSSFLTRLLRFHCRLERKGEAMVIGIPHDKVYWRKRSRLGYNVAKRLCDALMDAKRITYILQNGFTCLMVIATVLAI